MKTIKEYIINEAKFKDNLHNNLDNIEKSLTDELVELIDINNVLTINVDNNNINLLGDSENDNEKDSEIYSAASVITERYIKYLLNSKINAEDYSNSNFKKLINSIDNINVGTYNSFDYDLDDLRFEIKCYHKLDNNGIYLTDKQKSEIGPDALFILIKIGVSNKNITLKDIVVKFRKNLTISSNYITGSK